MVFLKIISIFYILFSLGCTKAISKNKKIKKLVNNLYIQKNIDIDNTDIFTKLLNEDDMKRTSLVYGDFNSTKSLQLNNNIQYIKIDYFNNKVVSSIQNILKNNNSINGLILDLRGNNGGLLSEAISLVDMFIDEGIIISTHSRKTKELFYASKNSTWGKLKIFILVNNKSASSSEIVSGVLQYYDRATIVGETTYGKGSIQEIIDIDKTKKLKITTGYYLIAGTKDIDKVGIVPDIIIIRNKIKMSRKVKSKNINALTHKFIFYENRDNVLWLGVKILSTIPTPYTSSS